MNKHFFKYASIGICNTAIHWASFLTILNSLQSSQSISNLIAFLISNTFSFIFNAKYTFKQKTTIPRYLKFVIFMASMSYAFGWLADVIAAPHLTTLIAFSAFSLVIGFFYSKNIVFK